MKRVSQRRKGRKKNFQIAAVRRREIERLARYLDALDTEDGDRYLIAWHWHNEQSNHPVDALMFAAERMGGSITEERAAEIIEEASKLRQRRTAVALGKYLGLTHAVRDLLAHHHQGHHQGQAYWREDPQRYAEAAESNDPRAQAP